MWNRDDDALLRRGDAATRRVKLAEAEVITPAEIDGFMASERKRWSTLIERAGPRLEGNA